LLPVPDVDRTRFFLIFGANPIVSNGSLMTAPGIARRLKAIRERGGEIVVVDPRRTETAEVATEHVFVQPGTDALLLAALVHTILKERGPRLRALASFTDGVDRLQRAVDRFSPEAVAPSVRIAADRIRSLALRFYDADPAVAYGRVGVSTQEFGALACWLLNALNVITGNFDRAGGAMFTKPAIDTVAMATMLGLRGSYARKRSRVRGLPEFGGEMPMAALADEILTPGEGQIRGLVTSAGNPVLSAANGRKLDRALASLEYMVAIDIYLNETTRHAHLILPPTFALEHDHYDVAFHLLAVRNTAKYSRAMFEKPPEARDDWEIFVELIHRLKRPRSLIDRLTTPLQELAMRLGPRALLELGLRLGPHRLSLARLEREPHGIDLGALEPCLPQRLPGKQRIDLAPELYFADLDRLAARMSRHTNGALALIGRRELRSNNSWMHNSPRMVKGKERCTLRMHPDDARARGCEDGKRVVLESSAGTIEVLLEVTDEMMPGVVCLPHGWGHDREGIRLSVAREHAGASINDVTDDNLIDDLSGTIRFSDVPVTVRPR
jgi:anaerobic selenocysteine-containing dehydrogenase